MNSESIHLTSELDSAFLESLAEFICGDDTDRFPEYRSSSYLTRFFQDVKVDAIHDGSTRKWWTLATLQQLQPSDIEKIILRLVSIKTYRGDKMKLSLAVRSMNEILLMENYKVGFVGINPAIFRAEGIAFDAIDILNGVNIDEKGFLEKQFDEDIDISQLNLDSVVTSILQDRVAEIQACPRTKVSLGTIFLLGSTLEGVLLGCMLKDVPKFASSLKAPKDKSGKVRAIYDWKLSEMIDVAADMSLLGLDVKKFSHSMRDFRNYIHPYQQMSQNFNPDEHTVAICWQVFKAAFRDLKENS
jgi:hypothetical protein